MSTAKPALPKGTRDFGPEEMMKRSYLLDVIREVYVRYGFLPLETPSMENLSVLTGKYGEEGDQLIFKVLNSGDFLGKVPDDARVHARTLLPYVAEKALRYDLTVPFARYVVMNRHAVAFPFKRYQMQPVWRADRPQKGRYREFYQCDADVVGTASLLCEAEIVVMITEVMARLRITDYTLRCNHRRLLAGLAEHVGQPGREGELCVAIDKLDKIGPTGVATELTNRGFTPAQVDALTPVFGLSGSNAQRLAALRTLLGHTDDARSGLDDFEALGGYLQQLGVAVPALALDPTLARGLSYYTGLIFELRVNQVQIGSVGGGGRYDNLTGMFGLDGVAGVGFSFGVDRLYDVLAELELFPEGRQVSTRVLIANFGAAAQPHALTLLAALRGAGVAAEYYPDEAKLKKQLAYANAKHVPHVVLIGSEELATQTYSLKDMDTGSQRALSRADLLAAVT